MIKGAVITVGILLMCAAFGWFIILAVQSFMRDNSEDDDDPLWPSV